MSLINFNWSDIFVPDPAQRLKTSGTLIDYGTNPNALTLATGQMALLDKDKRTIIAPTSVAANPEVWLTLAGPGAANLSTASSDGTGNWAMLQRPLYGNILVSAALKPYDPGTLHIHRIKGLNTPQSLTSYTIGVEISEPRADRRWNKARNLVVDTGVTTPDFGAAGITNATDWLIQNMVNAFNVVSFQHDHVPVVALCVSTDANAPGTVINTIKAGDTIDLGMGFSVTADYAFVASLTQAIGADATLATAKIMPVDTATAGANNYAEQILLVALQAKQGKVYDNIWRTHPVIASVKFTGTSRPNHEKLSDPVDPIGTGRNLSHYERLDGPLARRHKAEPWYTQDEETTAPPLVDSKGIYNQTTLYFEGPRKDVPPSYSQYSQTLTLLLPAKIDNPAATAGTAYTIVSDVPASPNLVDDLNGTLGTWALSAPNVEVYLPTGVTTLFV